MMKTVFISLLSLLYFASFAQQTDSRLLSTITDTAALDLKRIATQVTAAESSNFGKAKTLLNWLSTNFAWKATDYQTRSVKEILARKGGNCFELAKVFMALVNELNIRYRPIAEVNIQKINEERGRDAAELIKEKGNAYSLFGRQHNDHRWVEIYEEESKTWVPADPTMNIMGFEEWLKARAWFGKRHTINDVFSSEMIVPFAIYVVDKTDKRKIVESRTKEYLLIQLNNLYHNRLSALPSWSKWCRAIQELDAPVQNAFAGKENLHNYTGKISALAKIYEELKEEYASKYNER